MIGVLGAGQLGRMLALAGYPLGQRFRFLEPAAEAPAEQLAERVTGSYSDPAVWRERFVAGLEVVTYESENVPVALAHDLERTVPVYPPPAALEMSQDRLTEKTFFQRLGLPTAPFAAVDSRADLDRAVGELGLPAVLKTRRFGYDGKGQCLIREVGELEDAWRRLGGVPLLLEGFVRFGRELSVLAVRGRDGATAFYPLVENHHAEGLLRLSLAPAPNLTEQLQAQAVGHAGRVLEALDYVGVLAIEFFEQDRVLVANEMAPRVHNSGHWTIEGAETSQFENHLRAVLGLPLGSPAAVGACAMVNVIGTLPDTRALLTVPDAHLHLYGKTPRPGRKLGHVTLWARGAAALTERLARVREVLGGSSGLVAV
jgi:5-(carboxyamino)imidazole ribonucleotide synthase